MDLVFAGSSDFAVVTLDALARAEHRILAVLTQPDRPAGRKRRMTATPVKSYALRAGLKVLDPASLRDPDVLAELGALSPEIIVVVDYGLIVPRPVLQLPARGCVNGHASLLPRWRGAAPVERAVLAGDEETGVTVMQMEEGLDTGPILLSRSTPIDPSESAGELRARLATLCARSLLEALDGLAAETLTPRSQADAGACYAAKISTEEAAVDWTRSAEEIGRQVRAFNPRPGAHTSFGGKRLKIIEGSAIPGNGRHPPGTVYRVGPEGIDVATGDGTLRIQSLQLPGGRPQAAAAFLNGHEILSERLGSDQA